MHNKVELALRPGAEPLSWTEFCDTHPRYSIALDGYVYGMSQFDATGPWITLDHHGDVDRFSSRATCAQVWLCLRQGLFETFCDDMGHRAWVYANDCDEDVCLSWFLLRNPQFALMPLNARLQHLVQAVDLLDTTAGMALLPLNLRLMREIAWVFDPYRRARLQSAFDQPSASFQRKVIDSVGGRIKRYLIGKSEMLPLNTRYKRIGGGCGWAMVREMGAQSRMGMVADGIRAYVSVRSRRDGNWTYVLGRVSPFVPFDVLAILQALNEAEDARNGTWGGGNLVGGSPRRNGSKLSPQVVTRIVNGVVSRSTHSQLSHEELTSSAAADSWQYHRPGSKVVVSL